MHNFEAGTGMGICMQPRCALQALQDILDDDDDIGQMYLSRKARIKKMAQAANSQPETAPKHGGDDEVLVAHAEEVCNITLHLCQRQSMDTLDHCPSHHPASAPCLLC